MCFGGGSTSTEKSLNKDLTGIMREESGRRGQAFNTLMPYGQQQLSQGNPELDRLDPVLSGLRNTDYSSGAAARNVGTQRNAILRGFAGAGYQANDPSVLQTLSDFGAQNARAQDDVRTESERSYYDRLLQLILQKQGAKTQGAQLLTSLAGGSDPYQAAGLLRDLVLS